MSEINNYRGCLIGLALGDALCAPYEGGILERMLWKFFSKTKNNEIRYTDDTQMSIDLASSITAYKGINQDALAEKFANSYKWSRGYGPSAAKILKKMRRGENWRNLNKSQFKDGSFGNGAAMRIAPVALYYHQDRQQLLLAVEQSSIITHAHEYAIIGAKNIAITISLVINQLPNDMILDDLIKNNKSQYREKLLTAKKWLTSGKIADPEDVVITLGNGIQAINSTVTAIYIALTFMHLSYTDMIKFICKCKGDTDTIAAMAGAIWGARNGIKAINHPLLNRLESKQEIITLADSLFYLQQGNCA